MRSVATTAFWKVSWVRLSTPTSITAWASMFATSSRRIDRRRPNALCYFCTRTAPARSVGMGPSKSSSPSIDFLLGFARNANTMPTLRPASLSRRRRSSVCSETRQKVEKTDSHCHPRRHQSPDETGRTCGHRRACPERSGAQLSRPVCRWRPGGELPPSRPYDLQTRTR